MVSVAIGGGVEDGSGMVGVMMGNGHSDGLVYGDTDLADNGHINGVGFLHGNGIRLVHGNNVRLGNLDVNRDVVGFLDNVGLGNMHDIGAWHADLVGNGVRPLHLNGNGHRHLLRNGHLLVNADNLLDDVGNGHGLRHRHALVDRNRLVHGHGVWSGDRVGNRDRLGDLVHNHRGGRSVVAVSMAVAGEVGTISAVSSGVGSVGTVASVSVIISGRCQSEDGYSGDHGK